MMRSPDLRLYSGWGMSEAVFKPLLDALKIRPDAVIFGWSAGALDAIEIASCSGADSPWRALVLIAPTPCFVRRPDWPHGMDPDRFNAFEANHRQNPSANFKRFLTLQTLHDPRARHVTQALHRAAEDSRATPCGLARLRDTDLREQISAIQIPVMLIHGEQDRLIPVGASYWLAARLAQPHLLVLPDCGHAPHLSQTDQVASGVHDFLNRLG